MYKHYNTLGKNLLDICTYKDPETHQIKAKRTTCTQYTVSA